MDEQTRIWSGIEKMNITKQQNPLQEYNPHINQDIHDFKTCANNTNTHEKRSSLEVLKEHTTEKTKKVWRERGYRMQRQWQNY